MKWDAFKSLDLTCELAVSWYRVLETDRPVDDFCPHRIVAVKCQHDVEPRVFWPRMPDDEPPDDEDSENEPDEEDSASNTSTSSSSESTDSDNSLDSDTSGSSGAASAIVVECKVWRWARDPWTFEPKHLFRQSCFRHMCRRRTMCDPIGEHQYAMVT